MVECDYKVKDLNHTRHRVLIPGKTFLVGEYLALTGGPSIVINTEPCFEFSWISEESSGPLVRHPFHSDSPAGRWLEKNSEAAQGKFDDLKVEATHVIQFKDPFNGRGGFGGSTAEFAGAWIFRRWLEDPDQWNFSGQVVENLLDHRDTISPIWKSDRFGSQRFRDVLDDYRQTTSLGSGADMVSQITGGVAVWNGQIDEMRRFSWPFEDLAMSLVMTGKKTATHSHLAGLQPLDANVRTDMGEWVEEATQAFAFADADRLSASVRGFAKVLEENGRVAEHSRTWLAELAD